MAGRSSASSAGAAEEGGVYTISPANGAARVSGPSMSAGVANGELGMFKCLPAIHRWEEQIQHAKKEMRFVEQDFSIRGEKYKARKIATQKIHTFAVALTKPLGHVVKTFQYIMREGRLHPFEGTLLGDPFCCHQISVSGTHIDYRGSCRAYPSQYGSRLQRNAGGGDLAGQNSQKGNEHPHQRWNA